MGATLLRYLPLLGIVLLVFVLSKLDLNSMWQTITGLSPGWVAAAIAVFAVNMGFRGLRWFRILHHLHLPVTLRQSLQAYYSSQFYGSVTLGRVGELYRMRLLTDLNTEGGLALLATVVDRVIDILFLLFASTILLVSARSSETIAIISTLAASLIVLLYILIWGEPLLAKLRIQRLENLLAKAQSFLQAFRRVSTNPRQLESLLWTLISWALFVCTGLIIAHALNIAVDVNLMAMAIFVSVLVSILPITMHGVGTRELVFVQVFSIAGVSAEQAAAMSLVVLAVAVFTTLATSLPALLLEVRARKKR